MNKVMMSFAVLVLLVFGFAYYLLVKKPGDIRAQCMAEAELDPTAMAISEYKERNTFINTYYYQCLHRFGLNE